MICRIQISEEYTSARFNFNFTGEKSGSVWKVIFKGQLCYKIIIFFTKLFPWLPIDGIQFCMIYSFSYEHWTYVCSIYLHIFICHSLKKQMRSFRTSYSDTVFLKLKKSAIKNVFFSLYYNVILHQMVVLGRTLFMRSEFGIFGWFGGFVVMFW